MPKTVPDLLASGKLNYADYWAKHHTGVHHQNMRYFCLKME
jgi:hypothetical protein